MRTQTTTDSKPGKTAELYHEAYGDGSPLLLVPGIPGDAGQFAAVAPALAGACRAITYDRRANSRSRRPEGWTQTSVEEQVADAAALLGRLAPEPAVVYGTSVGAIVALELAVVRPDLVSRVVVHELPLLSVLDDPTPVASAIGAIVEPAFARGGPDAALEAFVRFAFGDAIVDGLDAHERARMLANGEVAMTIELPVFQEYRPDEAVLAALAVPAHVLVGRDEQLPLFHEGAAWLAEALGVKVETAPGAHGPQFDRPAELAACIAELGAFEPPRSRV